MQSKIELISQDALHTVEVALSALIGSNIDLSLISAQLQKKDLFLERQLGNNTYIELELRGAYHGDGCLIISTACVLRLCGKMLMLPASDINLALAEGDFEEQTEFVVEDITRAIIAAYIKTFQSPDTMLSSIVYKNKLAVTGVPEEGDLDFLKDEPAYYQISADVTMDGLSIGTISLLLPAFILLYSSYFKDGVDGFADRRGQTDDRENRQVSTSTYNGSRLEFVGLQQKNTTLDALFLPPLADAARELSKLLEVSLSVANTSHGFVDGESVYRSMHKAAHLTARFSLTGVVNEDVMIVVEPEHGVWLGALLAEGVHGVVLTRLQEASLNGDRQDGFAEICAIFMDFLVNAIRSKIKSDIDIVEKRVVEYIPDSTKVSSTEQIADRDYYISISKLSAGALGSADLHLLVPAKIIDLLLPKEAVQHDSAKTKADISPVEAGQVLEEEKETEPQQDQQIEPNVLIIDGDTGDGRVIQAQLAEDRVSSDVMSATAEIERTMLTSYSTIILVVNSLNETALGIAIKVNAISSAPLIVAASRWTQSDVFKAVRYGVVEILMTPTMPGEVVEKLKGLAGSRLS